MCIFLLLGVVLVELIGLMVAFGWVVPLIILILQKMRRRPTRAVGIVLAVWLPISCMLVGAVCLTSWTETYLIARFLPR